ncbi:hypothetical protein KY320_03615 [Candidatus Woesearchaeota archaeon]|nr:hypothetical protein [Candidatus Woesearchaeota archaeon]
MRKELLVLMGLVLVVLAGCKGKNTVSASDPFLGGTTGLLISFMEDAPPVEVYDGGDFPFDIVVKLTNDGVSDVAASDVRVKISGIDPAQFSKTSADLVRSPDEELIRTYKDSEGNEIEGITTLVAFDSLNYHETLSGNLQFPVRVDVCYKYSTKAVTQLCIKEDLQDTSEDAVCIVTGDKPVYSSRAPVQITDMKESVRGGERIGFVFTVKNMGNGNLYQKDSKCDTTGIKYENKVWIDVNSGMAGLECQGLSEGTSSSGYATLYGGERVITCTQDAASSTDYIKPVDITLTYDYRENQEKQLLVKHTVQ